MTHILSGDFMAGTGAPSPELPELGIITYALSMYFLAHRSGESQPLLALIMLYLTEAHVSR